MSNEATTKSPEAEEKPLVKILSQVELDALSDKDLEAYHHTLQEVGETVYAAKKASKKEMDTRASLKGLSPEALAAIQAKVIRAQGEKAGSEKGVI